MTKRAWMLRRVTARGFADDYREVWISRTGRRFLVERATMWNVVDRDGNRRGQAAAFSEWTLLKAEVVPPPPLDSRFRASPLQRPRSLDRRYRYRPLKHGVSVWLSICPTTHWGSAPLPYAKSGRQPVVANVRQFLLRIRARRRWSMHLGFAAAPDTNIGGTSNERFIYIYGLPFRRDAESLTESGVGLSVWGGGEYQHPLGDRVRLRLGMNASRNEYSGGRFDRMLVSLHAGPRVFVSRTTQFSILGDWRHQWNANDPNYFDLGSRVTASHRLTQRLRVNGRASWHDRRYRQRKYLDGPVRGFSLGAGWVLTPTIRLDGSAGYGRDRPRSRRYRSKSPWLEAGVSVALPKGFTVGAGAGVRFTRCARPMRSCTTTSGRAGS